jgi:hypothetical protein
MRNHTTHLASISSMTMRLVEPEPGAFSATNCFSQRNAIQIPDTDPDLHLISPLAKRLGK